MQHFRFVTLFSLFCISLFVCACQGGNTANTGAVLAPKPQLDPVRTGNPALGRLCLKQIGSAEPMTGEMNVTIGSVEGHWEKSKNEGGMAEPEMGARFVGSRSGDSLEVEVTMGTVAPSLEKWTYTNGVLNTGKIKFAVLGCL